MGMRLKVICLSLMIVAYPGDRGLCDGSIPRPGSPTECVYVSLSMVSCNTNTLQL